MRETASGRFLMTLWEGGGNIPPELGVARRLIGGGHHVHVLADPTIAGAAQAVGCTFTPWRRAPHRTALDPAQDPIKDWETTNPLVLLKRARDGLIASPAAEYAADTAEQIEIFRPKAVVTDAFLFGSMIAAQAAKLPTVALIPNIWIIPTPGTTPMGPGFPYPKTALGRGRDTAMRAVINRLFRAGLPAINAARSSYGLAPLSSSYEQVLGVDRILVLTSPTFDYSAQAVPANVSYVGPILDDPDWADSWTAPWPDLDDRPLVLVGFSSTYQDQGPLLRRVVDALSALPLRAVVTRGQMLSADEVASTDNVAIVASAPHRQILTRASLVVSHCGHGTTIKALAAGVPMVCIPMGRDQNDTAARVVYHGAGIRLSPKASPARIGKAVQSVLGEDRFQAAATRLASAIADESTANLVPEMESLARTTSAARGA